MKHDVLLRVCVAAFGFAGVAATLGIIPGVSLRAEEKPAAPSLSPDSLAARLADAPTDAARDALIAATSPAPDPSALRDAMIRVEYEALLKGDLDRAEPLARYQEIFARRTNNRYGIFAAQVSQAEIHRRLGEFSEALALLTPIIVQVDESKESRLAVSAIMSRGIVYMYEADYQRALTDFRHALAISEANGYRDGAIPALNSIGEVFRAQSQPVRALEYYQRARDWLGDDTAWNNAFLFNNIAECHLALGDHAKAIDYLKRAGTIAAQSGQKPRAATTLALLGDLYREEGRMDEARDSLDRSLALAREGRDAAAQGRAQLGLAEWERARGDHLAALEQAQASVASFRRANEPDGLGAALTAAGREQHALGSLAQARGAFEEAIAITEAVRGRLAGGDLDAQTYFKSRVTPYQELVALLAETPGGAADALQMAERAKARTLLDIVRRGEPGAAAMMTADEHGREAELNRRLDVLNRRLTSERTRAVNADSPQLSEAETALDQARRDWDNFQTNLFSEHPSMARERPPAVPLTGSEIMQLTDGGKTALLEFVVTGNKTYLIAAAGGGEPSVQVFALDIGSEALARRGEAFREALAQRGLNWQEPARALYDDLLKASEPAWKSATRLVIVPDGPLWNLPFQALESAPDRCLLQDHALSYAPSLTFLRQSAHPAASPGVPHLLAFGNPALAGASSSSADRAAAAGALMGGEFVALPEAEKQIAAIQALYPPGNCSAYIGAQAHEDVFKREAPNFDILHLATHGVLNERNPFFSYLLMAQTDLAPDEDGFLEAREFMALHLHARLAVLSACETGRGQITAGEGVIGLGWALLVAGCPAAVLSQWKVDSAATTPLMVELHRQLRDGVSPDEALRRASLGLASQAKYSHPFYWAPFVVVGAGE